MKLLYPLLCLFFFTAQAEGATHSFFQNTLSIELPTELKQLSTSALNKRYGKQSAPPAFAFNNKKKNVSFSFTQYKTPATKKNMNKIHQSISSMLRKANDKAQWKKDKIYTRKGTKIAVYEYEMKSVGKYQYNITYALPVNGQLTFISFVTTNSKYKKKWITLARESMESIQITEH